MSSELELGVHHGSRRYVLKDADTISRRKVYCLKRGRTQQVAGFVEAKRLTPFHDENLQKCTKELNSILAKYANKKGNEKQELAFLDTTNGLFLAWTENVEFDLDDDSSLTDLGIK